MGTNFELNRFTSFSKRQRNPDKVPVEKLLSEIKFPIGEINSHRGFNKNQILIKTN